MPPPGYQQTIEAIASCGVPAAKVRISYEDELRSDLITIKDLGGEDEVKFRCLKQAVHPFYILEIEAAGQREAYFAFVNREDRRQAKAEAIAWFDARGLLGRVPRYDPAQGLDEFARALEAACSIRSGSALEVVGSFGFTFRRSFMEHFMSAKAQDEFTCVSRMLAASNADEHDIGLGFVGNEATSEDPR